MRKSVRLARGALLVILAAAPFAAPQTKTQGSFVEVEVAPRLALAGQPVVISGKTGYHEKRNIDVSTALAPMKEERPLPQLLLLR